LVSAALGRLVHLCVDLIRGRDVRVAEDHLSILRRAIAAMLAGTAEVDALVAHQDQINVCLFSRYNDRKDKHFE
jgi:hypothetical protein